MRAAPARSIAANFDRAPRPLTVRPQIAGVGAPEPEECAEPSVAGREDSGTAPRAPGAAPGTNGATFRRSVSWPEAEGKLLRAFGSLTSSVKPTSRSMLRTHGSPRSI